MYASIAANHYRNIFHEKLKGYLICYDWTNINFPAGPSDYSTFKKKNNEKYAVNVFDAADDKLQKDIRSCYISPHNKKRDHQKNLLMITDGQGTWHYISIKSISALLKGISSKHNSDFYCIVISVIFIVLFLFLL